MNKRDILKHLNNKFPKLGKQENMSFIDNLKDMMSVFMKFKEPQYTFSVKDEKTNGKIKKIKQHKLELFENIDLKDETNQD